MRPFTGASSATIATTPCVDHSTDGSITRSGCLVFATMRGLCGVARRTGSRRQRDTERPQFSASTSPAVMLWFETGFGTTRARMTTRNAQAPSAAPTQASGATSVLGATSLCASHSLLIVLIMSGYAQGGRSVVSILKIVPQACAAGTQPTSAAGDLIFTTPSAAASPSSARRGSRLRAVG